MITDIYTYCRPHPTQLPEHTKLPNDVCYFLTVIISFATLHNEAYIDML